MLSSCREPRDLPVCSAILPFASRRFCRDTVACNARARAKLGMSKSLCGLWKHRDFQRKRSGRMTPAARSEVQRILDAEARRILAARLEGDAIVATARRDESPGEDGLDDSAPGLEAQAAPILDSVENDGGSVDAL